MIRKKKKWEDKLGKSTKSVKSPYGKDRNYPKEGQKGVRGFTGLYTGDIDDERAHKMALLGLTDAQIAIAFGVSSKTIEKWKQRYESFGASIRAGRVEADSEVALGLYKKAKGYTYMDTQVLANRVTEYDENGKPVRSYNEPLMVRVEKHVPPDAWAAVKWLSRRQPEYWTETHRLDHRHLIAGQIEFSMDQILEVISDNDSFSDGELAEIAGEGIENMKKQLTNGSNSNGTDTDH